MSSPFWYLAPGREVPLEIEPSDRSDWKSLKDQTTEPFASRWRPVTLRLEVDLELPDLFESGTKCVVSQRLRALCEQREVKAEYLPVRIAHSDGKVLSESYAILHPLEAIDCIDLGASDFDRYGTADNFIVARFRRLVFRPEAVGDRAVFRPQRYSPIFASNEFRETVLAAGLSVSFYPPQGQEN